MKLFIHIFSMYLLNPYSVSGTVLVSFLPGGLLVKSGVIAKFVGIFLGGCKQRG